MPRPFQPTVSTAHTATRPESLRAPASVSVQGFGMGSGNRVHGGIAACRFDNDGGGGWKAV